LTQSSSPQSSTLEQAIALKRRVTEELRPSILDNFGLFAALRWQFKKTWSNSEVVSTESYPNVEPQFESHEAIANRYIRAKERPNNYFT
jgi:signal transduction histidine kinase